MSARKVIGSASRGHGLAPLRAEGRESAHTSATQGTADSLWKARPSPSLARIDQTEP